VIRCAGCGFENRTGIRFCEECGAKLDQICPACGAPVPPARKFCGACGTPLATAEAQLRFGSPDSYTPKHLAEKILTSKAALEGERKLVTVLFADLKGSMELLADRDPEEARRLLDPVLERMMEAVHRYEGTINQVMGDGIMALFGAPLAHEDHAVRACYAALRMQESVRHYAEEIRRSHGVTVQIRVGLNSGEVVVRSIRSDLHMDYTAVGQSTHLAARMEQMATPGSILTTEKTVTLAQGYVEVKPLGLVAIKGLERRVEVYELTGAGTIRSRLHAATTRGLTRFIGRDSELDQLRQALERACTGHGQVVAVVGEPGVGKSRFFWEFTHSPRTDGWLILETQSVSYGKATGYLPVIDLLKAHFQIEGSDDSGKIREKVTGKLSLDEALKPTLPAFLSLLDVPMEDVEWERLDPPQRRHRTLDAVKHLLLRETQMRPLLVVFEDLHWIDSETQALLDSLVESVPTASLLLLISYRPEYQHPWGHKTYYTQVRMDPLPPERAEELLEDLVGKDSGLSPFKRRVIEQTEGNPFFIEETVRAMIETHVLVGERGTHRLAKDVMAVGVAPTVQAVLAARIDRLSPEDKRLLQSAATIGKDVPFALLQAIAELSDEDLRRGLANLQRAEFLYEATFFPDLEYTFKHALTHEVAYGTMLQERRRALHGRIVNCIETLYSDRSGEYTDALAHHASSGELWDKALRYRHDAGTRARDRAAYRAAVSHLEQALVAAQHLPQTSEVVEESIDIRLALQRALFALNEIGRCLGEVREAERLAVSINDGPRLASINSQAILYFLAAGEPEAAVASGQRALTLAKNRQDRRGEAIIKARLGYVFQGVGRYREATTSLTESLELSGDHEIERIVSRRAWLCLVLSDLGQFEQGAAQAQTALEIAQAARAPFDLVSAHFSLGYCHLQRGRLDEAIPRLERAYELCQQQGSDVWLFAVAASLIAAYARSGQRASAVQRIQEFRAAEESIRPHFWFAFACAWLSEALLLLGRPEEGAEYAERGITLSRLYHARGAEVAACLARAEVAAGHPVDMALALTNYATATALAGELEMGPLLGRCHVGLGRLYRQTGGRQQAHEHLTTASTMFRKMDMPFWLEQTESEIATLR
jgi:class 3 adenylate cyclase/tetratricopeptide (TPR) repeat protein